MKNHKTFGGMMRAAERVIAELESTPINDERTEREMDRKVSSIHRELAALWSSPADAEDAGRMAARLSDAWNKNVLS
jgi:hypothetical protein